MNSADKLIKQLLEQDNKQSWNKNTALFKEAAKMIQEQQESLSCNNEFYFDRFQMARKENIRIRKKGNIKTVLLVFFCNYYYFLLGGFTMAELSFIKTNIGLVPHTEHDKEIYNRWKLGAVIIGNFKEIRNPQFHRKLFSLFNLAFDYYEPSSGVLTADEKRIATKIFMTLDNHNNKNGFFINYGREFLRAESEDRRATIETIEKAFEPFRKWLIIEAGFFDVVIVPRGTVKEAKSISFASMGESEFGILYKSVLNVCWRFILSRTFSSEAEVENAADQLLSYN